MRKLAILASIAILGALSLSACNKKQAAPVETPVTMPSSATDQAGWKKYLVYVVKHNLQGMTSNRPFLYFIPSGDDDATIAQRENQFSNIHDVVLRTVLPGNLMAFGGPSSKITADIITGAFKDAQPASFKGVIVLFIGDQADKQRVADALKPSGATLRFVQMK